jgi:hypothetical protein
MNEIDISQDLDNNITEGQLIIIDDIFESVNDAIAAGIARIPKENFALVFVNVTGLKQSMSLDMKKAFSSRNDPIIFTELIDEKVFKEWLCQPGNRESDVCLVGMVTKSNGIETDIVVHVIPSKCSFCKVSSEDPVIISRAKAMLIVATYQKITCSKCKKSSSSTLCSLTNSSVPSSSRSSLQVFRTNSCER